MTQVYFKNIEQEILSFLASAESRIYLAVAWFTNQVLFDCLVNACHRNIEVKVLILDDILNRNEFGLDYGLLANNGTKIRYAKSKRGMMHNKFCIIDDKVITGSYNWTYHANINNENVVVIDEVENVSCYCEQFEMLFSSGEPIKLPYEHIKWTDVKEGDFSELGRNIFREVKAQNDKDTGLKCAKLISLHNAYKSGRVEDLVSACSLPTTEYYNRTITDVLTSQSQDYIFKLWEENPDGTPINNVSGYTQLRKWWFNPISIKEDPNHREFIEGHLIVLSYGRTKGEHRSRIGKKLKLMIYDDSFVKTIKRFCEKRKRITTDGLIPWIVIKEIPDYVLYINLARLFYYRFPFPMFNKSQPTRLENGLTRKIHGINLLGIAQNVDGDNILFYDGWNPQKRGEKIMKAFFVKA